MRSHAVEQTEPGRVAAFFDLDKTLLTVNSGKLWMKREFREGRINLRQVAMGSMYILLYHFGVVDMERAMGRALGTVRGLSEEQVRQWTREWFETEVRPFAAPGAAAVIAEHRAAGHLTVLLTSSSPYASECATELFGLDTFLCSRFEVEKGLFSGRIVAPLCYGPGKVEHARRLARERDLDLARSFFYTDSFTDLPMLEAVGNPRVVQPDPRLRREARRRGWPVLDWRRLEA